MTTDPTAGTSQGLRGAFRRGSRNAVSPAGPLAPGDLAPGAGSGSGSGEVLGTDVLAPTKSKPGKLGKADKGAVPPKGASPTTAEPAVKGGVVTIPVTSNPLQDELPGPGTVVPPVTGTVPVQRGPRKARLQIRQVDPWSVMKLGFLLSLAIGIVFCVSIAILWSLLDSGGVFDSVNKFVADVANDQTDFKVQSSLAFRRVMGVTLVLAVVQVVLVTALATLAAFLYNLASGLVGGLDVTLVEES